MNIAPAINFYLISGTATFTSLGITPMIGGTNNAGISPGLDSFDGSVAEIILYSESLSAAEKQLVTSYLALKYGIHIPGNCTSRSGVLWDATANATYHHDVFGLGKDNGSGLNQTSSNSSNSSSGDGTGQNGEGNVVLSNPSSLDNGDFLLIGHDNTVITNQYTDIPPELTNQARITREWKVTHTNDVGTVDLSFDLEGLPLLGLPSSTDLTAYNILIDEDGDFTTGTVTIVNASSINVPVINFTGITLGDDVVFTFSMRLSHT